MSDVQETIKKDIETYHVILFMKGSKLMPHCGFSARVVEVLNQHGIEYETRDVLKDDELRQGIKEFSNWPTLPQLYIKGNFIGGCDIVLQLHEEGKLETLLKKRS
ncbi:MAG: Grx4 family monothiol glutaredoxin [Simkaniaceae bacterium]|jgi:monothiol glutaredoxin|nr:MAG: Grx4 family monothiol glutaredoxin [Simkaniaceae bacterium]